MIDVTIKYLISLAFAPQSFPGSGVFLEQSRKCSQSLMIGYIIHGKIAKAFLEVNVAII